MRASLTGHLWTIAPVLRHRVRPERAPESVPWSITLDDSRFGAVTLRGSLRDVPGSDAAVIVVHGLGGTRDNHYCISAARAAEAHGVSCLRLSLRGAERDGEDIYHGGLAGDLHEVVASPALARYARLYVLGFSLGGHVTLRYALAEGGASGSTHDPRVRAVAAICSPLDLELSGRHMDGPRAALYRGHLLTGLKDMYRAVADRRAGALPTPLPRVLAARTLREWDALTVVPRFGFASVDDYYARMSVGPALSRLALPALLVQQRHDPMIPPATFERYLAAAPEALSVRWLADGGHVGYPAGADLGVNGPRGVEAQAIGWLLGH